MTRNEICGRMNLDREEKKMSEYGWTLTASEWREKFESLQEEHEQSIKELEQVSEALEKVNRELEDNRLDAWFEDR